MFQIEVSNEWKNMMCLRNMQKVPFWELIAIANRKRRIHNGGVSQETWSGKVLKNLQQDDLG